MWLIDYGVVPGSSILDAGCGCEQHQLAGAAGNVASDWVFLMRCWTQEELSSTLARHGFRPLAYYGAFDQAVAAESTDRLVALARCSDEVRGRWLRRSLLILGQ